MKNKIEHYDLVVVGAGVAGLLFVKRAAERAIQQKLPVNILILEAGINTGMDKPSHLASVDSFHESLYKTPNSPYLNNQNAPTEPDIPFFALPDEIYYKQVGQHPFNSNGTRSLGGTTLHWMGIALRMLPEDFKMETRFGLGYDWPIDYADLVKYYQEAEYELGVSGNAEDQNNSFSTKEVGYFDSDYNFPMEGIKQSFLDKKLMEKVGKKIEFDYLNDTYRTHFSSVPQARNSTPRRTSLSKRGTKVFEPLGAPYDLKSGIGQRCQGNASCIPICPVNAKYTALRTYKEIEELASSPYVKITTKTQSIVTKLCLVNDEAKENKVTKGKIRAINYSHYDHSQIKAKTNKQVEARHFVLAASAIENSKILLASDEKGSGFANSSNQVGKNLMDHPFVLNWGYMRDDDIELGTFRGPGITSDLPVRQGSFRAQHAGFRTDISNWGWGLANNAPYRDLERLIDPNIYRDKFSEMTFPIGSRPLYGENLKRQLRNDTQKQITFGYLFEQLPSSKNYVKIDPNWLDRLGHYKPVIKYEIDDYVIKGVECAYELTKKIFHKAGIINCTNLNDGIGNEVESSSGFKFKYIGAGHIMGTHRMGRIENESVVDENQKSWDHSNLYIIGAGSMPTAGTSNPTLTLAALSLKSADHYSLNRE